MSRTRKMLNFNQSNMQRFNFDIEEGYLHVIRNLGSTVIDPGSGIDFDELDRQGVFAPSGNYGGFELSGSRQILTAAPGAVLAKQVIVYGSLILNNAYLECEGALPAITVKSGGRLIVSHCHISKESNKQAATDSFILVETGGYASVNNCMFHGNQSDTGNLVRNLDAVNTGRVAVVGCANLTDVVTAPYFQVGYSQDVP